MFAIIFVVSVAFAVVFYPDAGSKNTTVGSNVTYTLTVLNDGPPDTFNLTITATSTNSTAALNQTSVSLGPGGSTTVFLNVSGSSPGPKNTTVNVTSTSAPTNSNVTTVTSIFSPSGDGIPPIISIISPSNTTYSNSTILVNISASDNINISTIWYNWNGTNVTYTVPINVTFINGTNTLHAWANDTSGLLNYTNVTFTVNFTSQSDIYEPDNSLGTATWISVDGTHQTHTFYPAADIDYVKFNATANMTYIIRTYNNTPQSMNLTDTFMDLYNASGAYLAESDDAGPTDRTSEIWFKAAANGTYYISVQEYNNNAGGSYDISVAQQGVLIPTIQSITNTTIDKNQTFSITTNVQCIGGPCGRVVASLDPRGEGADSPKSLLDMAETGDVRVIIKLKDVEYIGESDKKEKIKQKQDAVLSALSQDEFKLGNKYSVVNAMSGKVNKAGMLKLMNNPDVEYLEYDAPVHALLDVSVPLINATKVWNITVGGQSINGSGETVCVVDTGVNYTHPDFGACSVTANINDGSCPKVIGGHDFVNSDNNPMDDHGHGSHVAGIIASMDPTYRGVAPGAKIVAIKALDAAGSGFDADIIAGIDWCVNNASAFNISVISMSIGGNAYTDGKPCDTFQQSYAASINNAIAKNITVVVASGNEYYGYSLRGGMDVPSCIKNATSVGATDDSDVITTFTNRNNQLDVLAPGSGIIATNYNTSGHVSKSGTSMATPHVAGVVALMNQYSRLKYGRKYISHNIELTMKDAGKLVQDSTGRNALVYPRVDALASVLEKGVIPTAVGATPFYTTSQNPASDACLQNMTAGSSCNSTWVVNATGEYGAYQFFTIYETYYDVFYTNKQSVGIVPSAIIPPNTTSFSTQYGSTNFSAVSDITNVTNLTLANQGGKIQFPASHGVNASGQNYDSYVTIGDGFISVDTSNLHPTFNSSATIVIANVTCPATIYFASGVFGSKQDVVNNGRICNATTAPPCVNITCVGGNLTFVVSHFTGYAFAATANMTIWDETDAGMPYGGQIKYPNNQTKIFANYTNSSGAITSASCAVNFTGSLNNVMVYNATTLLYEYNKSFSSAGQKQYNITCNKTGFDSLSASDYVQISSVAPWPSGVGLAVTPSAGSLLVSWNDAGMPSATYNVYYTTAKDWLSVYQNVEANDITDKNFDVIDIEPDTFEQANITDIINNGTLPLAYVNIGWAESWRSYWNNSWNYSNGSLNTAVAPSWLLADGDPNWPGEYYVDFTRPEWRQIINNVINETKSKGFYGIYMDNLEAGYQKRNDMIDTYGNASVYENLTEANMISFIRNISLAHRSNNFTIFPQNGLDVALNISPYIDGIGVESTYHEWFDNGGDIDYRQQNINVTVEKESILDQLVALNKLVLTLDYANSSYMSGVNYTFTRSRNHSYVPYASTMVLDSISIFSGFEPRVVSQSQGVVKKENVTSPYTITNLSTRRIYFVNVKAVNSTGSEDSNNVTVFAITLSDTTPPNISIASPANTTYGTTTILVNISASDNVGISRVWYNWNGTNVTYNAPFNLTLSNGAYNLLVWANDTSGNNASANVSFSVALPTIDHNWPMFRHDANHTGTTLSPGPLVNNTLWMFPTANSVYSSPAVFNGTIYVGSYDSNLYALDAITGAKKWNYETNGWIYSSPAVYDNLVYIVSNDKNMYAINITDGSLVWSYANITSWGTLTASSPAIFNGVIYLGSNLHRAVFALNATTGSQLWNFTVSTSIYSSPAVSNGAVYFGAYNNYFYVVNATSGNQIWNYSIGNFIESSPSVYNGIVYFGSWNNKVYALNATTGLHVWNYTTNDFIMSSPAVSNGIVYICSNDNKTYALNSTTGSLIWNYTASLATWNNPAVSNGIVYVPSGDGLLYALDATTGSLIWKYNNSGGWSAGSPTISNNTIYFGSRGGNVYAVGPDLTQALIKFIYPTVSSGSYLDKKWIDVVASANVSNITNITIYLYNSNNTLINSSASNSSSLTANFTGLSRGVYRFNATVYYDAGNSSSTETRWVEIGQDIYEPDDTLATASWISTDGSRQTHTFSSGEDYDFIKFNATANFTYIIKTYNNTPQDITDTLVDLYNASGVSLAEGDDYNTTDRMSEIWFKAAVNGTYYVSVEEYYDNFNTSYDISVTQQGVLISSIQNITSLTNDRNQVFNVTTTVQCIGGPCGRVTASLDPDALDVRNQSARPPKSLLDMAETGDVRVIIKLKDVEYIGESDKKEKIKQKQDAVLSALSQDEFKLGNKYSVVNAMSGKVNKAGMLKLMNNPDVEYVENDSLVHTMLDVSVPLINATKVWNITVGGQSINGSGETVCVVDTGVNYTHPDFGACSVTANINDGSCPKVIGGYDFVNLDNNPMDDDGHGSHCAGIIASMDPTYRGVAPGAKIVAIKVLDDTGSGYDSDILAGIDWCVNNASALNISVISMSLGGYEYTDGRPCDAFDQSAAAAINSAVANNITVAVASGNGYYGYYMGDMGGLSSPACVKNATSVGATDDSDVITDFTDRNNQLDVLAPGKNIMATNYLGGHVQLSGTSMATPHVAGVAALMNQYSRLKYGRKAIPHDLELMLKMTGKPVVDIQGVNSLTYPRVDVLGATLAKGIISTAFGATPFYTTSQNPAGDACLQNMTAGSSCNSTWVVNATGDYGVYQFFTIYETRYDIYNTNKLNVTIADVTPPSIFIASPTNTTYNVSVILVNISATDNINVSTIWYNWNGTNVMYTAPVNVTFIAGTTVLHVWANDTSGNNASVNVSFIVSIPDTTPPSVSISSPQNRTYNVSTILVNISATDNINVSTVWYNWNGTNTTYTGPINVTFSDGLRTLNAWANDTSGIINNASVSFTVDTVAPAVVDSLPIAPGYYNITKIINVTITDTNNFNSSLYVNGSVVNLSSGTNSSNLLFGLVADGNYTYYATAIDVAGNFNSTTPVAGVVIDKTVPVVIINAMPDYVNTTSISVLGTFIEAHPASIIINGVTATIAGGNYNATISLGSDANITVTAVITDLAGNVNSTSDWIVRDTLVPNVTFVQPTEISSSFLNRRWIIINATAADANLLNTTIRLYNSSGSLINSTTSAASTIPANFSVPADGIYYFNATTTDRAGNANYTETRNATVDTLLPSIAIITPANTTYNNRTVLVNISASGASNVWYNWNGTNTTYTNPVNITFTEGTNTLYAYANDSAGNFNSTSRTFTTDTIPPSISVTSPANTTYGNRTVLVSISAPGAASIWYNWNGTNIAYAGPVNVTFSEGANTLLAYANDTIGNLNTTNVTFITDTVLPTISIVSPSNTTYNTTTILLNISATDSINLSKVWYNWNGTNITYNSPVNITFSEGVNSLQAWANDSVGNKNYTNVSFIVDTVLPSVLLLGPANNSLDGDGNIMFNTSAADNLALKNISLYINDVINQTQLIGGTSNSTLFNVSLANGTYSWKIGVHDISGNYNESETRQLMVNTSAVPVYNTSTYTGNSTNWLILPDLNNVTNPVLDTLFGMILWQNPVNATGANFTANIIFGHNNITVLSAGLHPSFNATAILVMRNLTWNTTPIILRDGVFCPETECFNITYNGLTATFVVTHFTSYVTDVNANMTIWDETDAGMPYAGQIRYRDNQTIFFANYTNTTGNAITGADCLINFTDSTNNIMVYNATSNLYEYNRIFSNAGNYTYAVSCNKTGFNRLTTSDYVIITPAPNEVVFAFLGPANGSYTTNQTLEFNFTGQSDTNTTFGCELFLSGTGRGVNNSVQNNTATVIIANTTFADGIYSWFINCTTGNDTTKSPVRIITIDTVTPSIGFIQPTEINGQSLNRNWIAVNVSINETNVVNTTIMLYNSSGLVTSSTGSTSPFFANFTGLANGVYYFNATTIDAVNHTNSTSTRSVTVDATSPQVSYISPTDTGGSYVNRSWIAVKVTATDANLSNITIRLYNISGLLLDSMTSFSDPALKVFLGLGDGLYFFNATAYDIAGNSNITATRNVTVDTTWPIVSDTSPIAPGYYNITKTVSATFSDANNIVAQLYVNGSVVNSSAGINSTILTYALTNDGNYSYLAYITDPAGNYNSTAQVSGIIIDKTTPIVTINALPDYTNVTTVSVTGNYTEINLANITVNGVLATAGAGVYNATIPLTIEGNNTITVVIADLAGNVNSSSDWIVSDTVGPDIYLVSPTETSGSYVNRNWILVNATVNDTNVANITIRLYNSSGSLINSSTTVSSGANYVNFTVADGQYFFNATVYDIVGHYNFTETRNVTADTLTPQISFVSPTETNGSLLNRSWFVVNVSVIEANLANVTINLYNSTGALINSTVSISSLAFANYSGLADGSYLFNATAYDLTGKINITGTRTVFVDATSPNVSFISPTPPDGTIVPQSYSSVINVSVTKNASSCTLSLKSDVNFGEGSDSVLNVSSLNMIIDNYTYLTGNESIGDTIIAVNSASGFSSGNEILIMQMQNSSGGIAGTYEFANISYISGNNITLVSPLTRSYSSGVFNTINGTVTQIVRVPHYTNVTINSGASLTSPAWNGYTGGILIFRASGIVNVIGNIDVTQRGFRTNEGPGGGMDGSGPLEGGGGGGYGGAGGDGWYFNATNSNKGSSYGNSNLSTILLGSGGGKGTGQCVGNGGIGGGIVQIYADTLILNGSVLSSGQTGQGTFASAAGGGGGSGGSVLIRTNALQGSGIVSAVGGNGGYCSYHALLSTTGGGGGGGRLIVSSVSNGSWNGTISAVKGLGGTDPALFWTTGSGANGSVLSTSYASNYVMAVNNAGSNTNANYSLTGFVAGVNAYWVSCNDSSGNVGLTETRNILVDVISPGVHLIGPSNNTKTNQSLQTFACNATDNMRLSNLTLYVWNSTGSNVNTTTTALNGTSNSTNWIVLLPYDDAFLWNCLGRDTVDNSAWSTEGNYTLVLDRSAPAVGFSVPTETSGSHVSRNWMLINATVNETYFANMTVRLYNSSGSLVRSNTTTSTALFLNYTGLADGIYFFNATAYDLAGNSNITVTRNVTLDTTIPQIYLVAPTEISGMFLNRSWVLINVTTVELNLASILVDLYNTTAQVNTTTLSSSPAYVNFSIPSDGVYFFNATAFDLAGNSNITSTRNITIDTVLPMIIDNSGLVNNSYHNITKIINISITDVNNFNSSLYVNGSVVNLSSGTNSSDLLFGLVADGNYTYYAIAIDVAGNFNSTTPVAGVVIDKTIPIVTINALPDYTNATTVSVTGNYTEINLANITINGVLATAGAGVYNTTIPLGIEGNNTITVVIADLAGNVNSSSDWIVRDTILPTITDSSGLANNTYYNTSKLINVSISDANNFAAQLYLNGSVVNISSGTNSSIFMFNLAADGNYTYFANATDVAGNYNSTTPISGVIIDLTPPTVVINPLPDYVNTVSSSVAGNYTEINLANITVNGVLATAGAGVYNATIPLGIEGNNTITVVITDLAGNVNSASDWVVRDTIIPNITFVYPTDTNNTYLNRNFIVLNVSANDTNTNIANITTYIYNATGGLVNSTFTIANGSFVNFTVPADGVYFFNATTYDLAGNANSTDTRNVTVDTGYPQVLFTPPTEISGSYVNRTWILINATAIEANLANVTVSLYNSVGALINSTTLTTSPVYANYTIPADGMYFFNATVYDLSGNSNYTETRNVTTDMIPPVLIDNSPIAPGYYNITKIINVSITDVNNFNASLYVNGSVVNLSSGTNSSNLLFGLAADGNYTYYATAIDVAGNFNSTTPVAGVVIDKTVPVVIINAMPDYTNVTTVSVTGNYTEINLANITVNGVLATAGAGVYNATIPLGIEGNNTITVVITDLAGNVNFASDWIVRDTIVPIVVIYPLPDYINSSTVSVTGNYTESNLANITVNGVLATAGAGLYNATIPLAEGNNTITAVIIDLAGNANSSSDWIIKDTTAPAITDNSAISAGYYNVTKIINVTVTDANSFTAQLYVNGSVVNSSSGTNNSVLIYVLSAEGNYTYFVNATDIVNNSNSTTQISNIIIDKTNPTVQIFSPANGSTVGGSTASIDAIGSDTYLSVMYLYIDGALKSTVGSSPLLYNWSLILYPEGWHNITAVSRDLAGNINTTTITAYIDRTAPTSNITYPAANILTKNSTVIITGIASDTANSTVSLIEVFNGAAWATANGTNAWNFSFSPGTDGTYNIRSRATDQWNNTETPSAGINIIYDSTVPTIIGIQATPNPASNTSMIYITAYASDLNGIANVNATLNGTTIGLASAGGNKYIGNMSAPAAEGSYALNITAMDNATNIAYNASTIIVNNSIAVITLNPPQGTIFSSGSTITINVTNYDTAWYNTSVNATNVNIINGTQFSASGTDGSYILYVRANTSTGAETDPAFQYIIDNTPPAVTINAVTSPTALGTQIITGTYSDANINYVTVDGQVATIGGGIYSKTIALAEGINVVNVTAYDLAGNNNSAVTAIFKDTTKPVIVDNFPIAPGTYNISPAINVSITDANNLNATLYVNGLVASTTSGTNSTTLTYTIVPAGDYSYYIAATDSLGNTNTSSVQSGITVQYIVIGNASSINITNLNATNMTVTINGSTNFSGPLTGILPVVISDDILVSFNWNFSMANLNLSAVSLGIQNTTDQYGYIIVRGINLTQFGMTKSVYVNRKKASDYVCVKDLEINNISDISSGCTGANEYRVQCPGVSGAYTCSIVGGQYNVSGLSNSGVLEFTYTAPPAPPSGGGTTGGGGESLCIRTCTEWSECYSNGTQSRFCGDGGVCYPKNKTEWQNCTYNLTVPVPPSPPANISGTCSDGVKNQDETDTDCGGKTCGFCQNGGKCSADSDCFSDNCAGGVCLTKEVSPPTQPPVSPPGTKPVLPPLPYVFTPLGFMLMIAGMATAVILLKAASETKALRRYVRRRSEARGNNFVKRLKKYFERVRSINTKTRR